MFALCLGFPSRVRWNSNRNGTGIGFLKHVEYVDDMLEITEAGTYYVYSFVTFRLTETQNISFLNHYIYRDNTGQQLNRAQMIFMDKQTRLKGKVEFQTSFLAGILYLESHDRVYTVVSDISAVYGSPLSNFMGLFKL